MIFRVTYEQPNGSKYYVSLHTSSFVMIVVQNNEKRNFSVTFLSCIQLLLLERIAICCSRNNSIEPNFRILYLQNILVTIYLLNNLIWVKTNYLISQISNIESSNKQNLGQWNDPFRPQHKKTTATRTKKYPYQKNFIISYFKQDFNVLDYSLEISQAQFSE